MKLAELVGERSRADEAGLARDVLNGQVGFFEQLCRHLQANARKKNTGRLADPIRKHARQMLARYAELTCQCF